MVDAWSVVMHREPEWDDYSRAEAIAALTVDQFRCRSCGVEGAMEEVPRTARHWTWADGRRFEVTTWRCLSCAAEDTIRRDFYKAHENDKPVTGQYSATDGIRFAVTEIEPKEVADGGQA